MRARVIEASLSQTDAPQAEAPGLVTTLSDGRDGVVVRTVAASDPALTA